jgi:glutamine amidotransferase
MICIVDYKIGNTRSIQNMVYRAGFDAIISNRYEDIKNANRLILPGVGHFEKAMEMLDQYDLLELLNQVVLLDKKPVLGICLGMQLMTQHSEEGNCKGLGWIDATTMKFNPDDTFDVKVPHMGWNTVEFVKSDNLLKDMPKPSRFYFVHSYYVNCNHETDVFSHTHHGIKFASAFRKNNIIGVQFHPEKSHKYGLSFLRNFCAYGS